MKKNFWICCNKEKNYGKEGADIITDNCQLVLFGGFAPTSSSAESLSRYLGNQTVLSGSISKGKNDPSQSLQMIQRPLITTDELKLLPKGHFILAKTGCHPMKTELRLFLKWGIEPIADYVVAEQANRTVQYADKKELEDTKKLLKEAKTDEDGKKYPYTLGQYKEKLEAKEAEVSTLYRNLSDYTEELLELRREIRHLKLELKKYEDSKE